MELIGQIIKKNRIAKKLTLEQVAFELKISKETVKKIEKEGKIKIRTPFQIDSIEGQDKINAITIKSEDGKKEKIMTDYVLGFFGLIMKLGAIAEWGLNLEKKTIPVNTENFQTNKKGISYIR